MVERAITIADVLNLALRAYGGGANAQAEKLCLAIIRSAPEAFDALHLLAVIQASAGAHETALQTFARALEVRADSPEAWNNRGATLYDLDRFEEAVACFGKALDLRPGYAEARYNRGNAFRALGRFGEALECYGAVLSLRPDDAEAWNNQGTSLHSLARFEEALESFDRALALRADCAQAHYNRACTLHSLARSAQALAAFDAALAIKPDLVEALLNRGNLLREFRRFEEALDSYERALAAAPDNAEIWNNRAQVLAALKRHAEALASCDAALAKRPDFPEAMNNRGTVLSGLGRFEEALACYDAAIALRPNFAEALCNRGLAQKELGLLPEALASYDQALAIEPEHPECQWNRAVSLLLAGSFAQGWRAYEWRRRRDNWIARDLPGPEWRGGAPANRRLYFYSEQGLGDAIQFARFAARLAKAGAHVFLEVRPCLKQLMGSLAGVSVIGKGEPLPAFDAHLPLMSVPPLLQLAPGHFGQGVPYLSAEPERLAKWANRMPPGEFRVGIVWQGNPFGDVDRGRSIPLRAFAPLSRIPGVTLVSLQKNDGLEQLEDPCGFEVATLGADFDAGPDAFLDSAAAIMALDLVISSDTAIAHLAGALGRPVWVALKHVPDWRWMLGRGDSPWYPSMRLFRQRQPGDWRSVFEQTAEEVAGTARKASAAA